MEGYSLKRTCMSKFIKLSNKQYMKIIFDYKSRNNSWYMSIVVANSKRQCNDCLHKTEHSPKVIYGRSTGNKLGAEAFIIAKRELLEFEKAIHNTGISIFGASERLFSIYVRALSKYGYITKTVEYGRAKGRQYLFKEVY